MTGTVKDAVVYRNISKMLASRGIIRSQQQVVNKLKALRKQFSKVHDQNRKKSGAARRDWIHYDLCYSVFGNTALTNPVALSSSMAPSCTSTPISEDTPGTPAPSPAPTQPLSPLLFRDDSESSMQESSNPDDTQISETIEAVMEESTETTQTAANKETPMLQSNSKYSR